MGEYIQLTIGEPAPLFHQRSTSNELFDFGTVGGRYIVLCFYCTTRNEYGSAALSILKSHRHLFNDEKIAFFGVSIDPEDEQNSLKESVLGIRYFWDFDATISRLYGVLPVETKEPKNAPARPTWYVLDPAMRILKILPFQHDHQDIPEIVRYLKALPPVDEHAETPLTAPVLILPRVFEPDLCQRLIHLYEKHGGQDSGFMRQNGEKTVVKFDHIEKRRKDFTFSEQPEYERLRLHIQDRMRCRVIPEVTKTFQYEITRMERYIVACYEGESGGFFRAHRDNTTKATAHRRFACTINLNTSEYEGGDLRFPEFGSRTYRAPTGGAIIFSCSLLHEATPVTAGRRYAFLPFFYDEEGHKIREENRKYLEPCGDIEVTL